MTITACILSKDEEQKIENSLENIAPYVDEIVIVDGCSKDRTVPIARKYTAEIYQHEFLGSFAVERNYSIEQATGDWVFIMDADEVCEDSLLAGLKGLTKQNKYTAYSFMKEEVLPNGVVLGFESGHPQIQVKLAMRNRIQFYGVIHERAIVSGKVKFIPKTVYHHRDYMVDYPKEKAERFEEIARTSEEREQGIKVSRWFLVLRGVKLIYQYFLNMLIGLELYKEGARGVFKSIQYTTRFAVYGFSQYRRAGQI